MQSQQRRRRQQDLILDHLTALTNAEIRRFLRLHKIGGASAQAKDELRGILRDALKAGAITVQKVVRFLDEVTPWGKQHVYLYKVGPAAKNWRDKKWVAGHLKEHQLDDLIDATTDTIILPEEMQLACINWTPQLLRITAIRKREGWIRSEEHDKTTKKALDGRPLWLKGYVYQVLRGLTAFEWNLVANEAFLQITQLPSGSSYEAAQDEFKNKIEPWLDLSTFKPVDLRPAVKKLNEREQDGKGTVKSHALDYSRLGQRRLAVKSISTKVPLLGDRVLDGIIKTMRKDGIPRIGDFFFEADGTAADKDGQAHSRLHVKIMAAKGRINFATPSSEEGIRNVLTELRTLGQ
jgi:hypothetical protein